MSLLYNARNLFFRIIALYMISLHECSGCVEFYPIYTIFYIGTHRICQLCLTVKWQTHITVTMRGSHTDSRYEKFRSVHKTTLNRFFTEYINVETITHTSACCYTTL